jgi:exocyst complex component 2
MDERAILEFYHIQTLYPETWPAENNSDASDSEDERKKKKLQRRKSRYQALERTTTRRSLLDAGAKGGSGAVPQKDNPDPLGTSDSVVRSLKQLGVPGQEHGRLSMDMFPWRRGALER